MSGLIQKRSWLAVLCLGALMAFAPSAQADTVDFGCLGTSGGLACSGTATLSGSTFSSSGIGIWNTTGPYSSSDPFTAFTMVFDTAAGTISISGDTDGDGVVDAVLTGVIDSLVSGGSTFTQTVTMFVTWSSIPVDVQNQLGTPTGIDDAFVSFQLSDGVVTNVSVTIQPTPEPTSLVLFGSGLLAGAGFLKRKWRRA